MAQKKSDSLTPRQKQSQRIMREKATRKKRQALVRKIQLISGGFIAVVLLGSGVWLWKSGAAVRFVQGVQDNMYGYTAKKGFALQALYLEGRNRTAMGDIEKAISVKKGDPILRISLDDVRERLEHIESIRFAAVERELPGTLHIRIIEREPVALWQHNGKTALVDDQGIVMNDIDSKDYQQLPLIVGEDAPSHVAELLEILGSQPDLARRFASAIRVGERRWNIRLSNGAEVKLPEENPQGAWKILADLEQKQQLLDRDVKVIDLRVQGRLFIKLSPDDMPAKKAVNARET